MAHAHIASQARHVALMKNIANKTVALPYVQLTRIPGNDAGRVLASMLQHGQRIVDSLIDRPVSNYSDYPTHKFCFSSSDPSQKIRKFVGIRHVVRIHQLDTFWRHYANPIGHLIYVRHEQ